MAARLPFRTWRSAAAKAFGGAPEARVGTQVFFAPAPARKREESIKAKVALKAFVLKIVFSCQSVCTAHNLADPFLYSSVQGSFMLPLPEQPVLYPDAMPFRQTKDFKDYNAPKYDPHLVRAYPSLADHIAEEEDGRSVSMMMALANYADHMEHIERNPSFVPTSMRKLRYEFGTMRAFRDDHEMAVKGKKYLIYLKGRKVADTNAFKVVLKKYRHAAEQPLGERSTAIIDYSNALQESEQQISERLKPVLKSMIEAKVHVPRSAFQWNSTK